jgi:hypothetical protein
MDKGWSLETKDVGQFSRPTTNCYCPEGRSMTPNCCSKPKASNSPQCSMIFPSEMRNQSIP